MILCRGYSAATGRQRGEGSGPNIFHNYVESHYYVIEGPADIAQIPEPKLICGSLPNKLQNTYEIACKNRIWSKAFVFP